VSCSLPEAQGQTPFFQGDPVASWRVGTSGNSAARLSAIRASGPARPRLFVTGAVTSVRVCRRSQGPATTVHHRPSFALVSGEKA